MSCKTQALAIGGFGHVDALMIGGGSPVVIQTMWKDRLSFSDVDGKAGRALTERIGRLKAMGCGLLRFAVPDLEAAEVLGRLAAMVSMPLVADIHFDYKIALRCLDFPISKIRINPGNIGGRQKVEAVLGKAASKKIPIRIGVNAGSLPRDLRRGVEGGMDRAEALVEAAERELAIFREWGFAGALVSIKASTIADTIKANRLFRERSEVPLHIGVTEAGPLIAGTVRNTAALVPLLAEGIGDTIRVSLSDAMENEVAAGREILNAAAEMGSSRACRGVRIISCPRCGRNGFDTHGFIDRWKERLYALQKPVTIAVMGCAVNGPGEAKCADLGITGAGNSILIFRNGRITRTMKIHNGDMSEADRAFTEELARL
ncbi:MAG: (E)-4-hydroxy-3-methylbut-2-enyl-diphosphate synthase [Spirochaetaceae bacterium]|jgi:(E)-4-hydroxy-3-methylbut-2-enyl-diphosphate synthase|nr:(E)-4-hydroxy-3-methylbut-2-enyl-diphosphate synthase [Spirochaetaceae bacterium]